MIQTLFRNIAVIQALFRNVAVIQTRIRNIAVIQTLFRNVAVIQTLFRGDILVSRYVIFCYAFRRTLAPSSCSPIFNCPIVGSSAGCNCAIYTIAELTIVLYEDK